MRIDRLVKPLLRQTLSGDVYAQLKELLMSGRMMPGQQLSLRSTAEALGVSVMPVREAIQRLVAEKALEVGPSRVVRVPTMNVSQFLELSSIRINLEGFAVEQACLRIDQAALLRIETLNRAFDDELEQQNPDGTKVISINKDLHFSIYRCAQMPMLLQLIEALWLRIGPILNYDLRSGSKRLETRAIVDNYTRLLKTVNHHTSLVEALKKQDSNAARAALKSDIENAAQFVMSSGSLVASE